MARVNWLLVGAGDLARKRVAAALRDARDSSLGAVCDLSRERAVDVAQEAVAADVYTDFADALRNTTANAVYLATPVWLHAQQAVQSLQSGRHTLIEKPLGLNAQEARRVASAAAKTDATAGCAYYRRCSPRYQHAKAMLENGTFGQVVLVRLLYYSWFCPAPDDPKHWRVVRDYSGGGPISDMGSHMFDVLIGLLGMPETVTANCTNLVHSWDVEDAAAILMTLPGGAQVTASFHWNSKTWRHEFELVGTEAKLNWLPCDSGPVVKTVGRDVEYIDLENPDNVHLPVVDDFIQAIRAKRAPACPVSEAVKTSRLIDAVYRSARDKRTVYL